MKYIFSFIIVMIMASSVDAQIVEVNPNVNWKFVRSQKLQLQSESVYQYEFPAEKGFDYIFNLFYDMRDLITYINVYDMQMKPIASIKDSLAYKTSKLEFRVSQSGTYLVMLGYKNKIPKEVAGEIEATLIRREIVE
ncbi:hypothetical protein N9595_02765 [Bacteroidia bacterium]|nr:hypothetical protein [Bacteroidia bacterium]